MRDWTQEELDALVECPKVIITPPRKEMRPERGSLRNDFEVASKDGKQRFHVFVRQSESFAEDFSIGLIYVPSDEPGEIPLFRCNGQHGTLPSGRLEGESHFAYHVHWPSAEALVVGSEAWSRIEVTRDYASFHEALWHLISITHIGGAEAVFPRHSQLALPGTSG